MPFVENTAPFFADFGGQVTVQGVQTTGIFDRATELTLGDALVQAPTLTVPGTVAAAEGGTVLVQGVSYRIRQALDLAPDGALRQLVLAQV